MDDDDYYPKNCFIAVRAIDEPFYIARCLTDITVTPNRPKMVKIKWLDKTENSTKYRLSYNDTVSTESIICKTNVKMLSRFFYCLEEAEEKLIISLLTNNEVELNPKNENQKDSTNTMSHNNSPRDILKIPEETKEQKEEDILISDFRSNNSQEIEGSEIFQKKNESNIQSSSECLQNFDAIQEEETIPPEKSKFIEETIVGNNIYKKSAENISSFSMNSELVDSSAFNTVGTNKDEACESIVDTPSSNKKIIILSDVRVNSNREIAKTSRSYDISPSSSEPEPFEDSGSEWVPQLEPDSNSDIEIPMCKQIVINKSEIFDKWNQTKTKKIANDSSSNRTSPFELSSEGASCSEYSQGTYEHSNQITLSQTTRKLTGNRIYDKRHACYFCYKLIAKLTRHLITAHSKELEVAKLLALNENSWERKKGFLCILRAGDYYHNNEVLTTRKGELILSRRPESSALNSTLHRQYGPCPYCLGFFLLKNLWHHCKYSCPQKITSLSTGSHNGVSRIGLKSESLALLGTCIDVSLDYQKQILSSFRNDEVSEICRNDSVIIKFGSLLHEKYNLQQHEFIRQTMRQLGRLIVEIRNRYPECDCLSKIMMPTNFDKLIQGVQSLCMEQRNEINSKSFRVPSLALKIGHSLRKCSLIVRGIALRKGDLSLNKEMESFLDLMSLEWNLRVSSAALRTIQESKMNTTQLLPITDDIIKLNVLLDQTIQELISDKYLPLSTTKWMRLAQATLSRIVLFNKRRSGEAARITLKQYTVRPNWSEECTSEMKNSLTPFELSLASKLTVVEVLGKSRKHFEVPILLTSDVKTAVDILIETRDKVGIARNNVYVFARGGGSLGHHRGHDCLRKFASEAHLQRPSSITSTKLRKYIATVVQIFNLKEAEYDWLARHLGHDIRIHREFYRLHENAIELSKVSRILLAIDKGEAARFKGKTLDEINLEELPALEEGSDESDISEEEQNTNIEKLQPGPSFDVESPKNYLKAEIQTVGEKKKTVRRPWSSSEKEVLIKYFKYSIRNGIVPKKGDAEKCIEENSSIFKERAWRDIKNWVYNYIRSVKSKK